MSGVDTSSGRVRGLLNEITPGRWTRPRWSNKAVMPARWAGEVGDPDQRGPFGIIHCSNLADAEFVAAAPAIVASLLDERDDLAAENGAVRDLASSLTEHDLLTNPVAHALASLLQQLGGS